jgi:hypothetical protein
MPVRVKKRIASASCAILLATAGMMTSVSAARAAGGGVAIDGSVWTHQSNPASSITSPTLSTTQSNDVVIAFLASDGPNSAISYSAVSGGGLTWRLRQRTNAQLGTAEIWEAVAPNPTSLTVTATRSDGSYVGSIDVVAFSGADTSIDGAVASDNGATGAPSVSLTTTRPGSWVWGVGNDYSHGAARTPGSNQTVFDQYLSPTDDTYWTQSQAAAGNPANNLVTLNDTAPTTDSWNISAIEIIPAGTASSNPPVISSVGASDITQNSATITWTTDIPSSSEVFYGASSSYGQSTSPNTAQVTSHSQTLTGLATGATYHYAVQSAGSVSTTATSGDNVFTTTTTNVTLPDMQIEVPTNAISIGTAAATGDRQLQFTHITWDAGTGPFEIDPTYNSSTGIATFNQAIYNSPSPGVWKLDHSVPISATGIFNPPSDYNFPLTRFTLNTVNSDGSLGSVVATSPKTDYCITGDAYVGGIPNTPNSTFIPQANCTDPTKPLGWSVGWGDEYDQTDSGQPIDLTGVADGTYVLHAIVDPDHVFTESNTSNNVTDTLLRISGGSVTVLSQTSPTSNPPTTAITSPAAGATVSGSVSVQASASATAPATVSSVQFYLDGVALGSAVTTLPYALNWDTTTAANGSHSLRATVTDSSGATASSPPVTVTVSNSVQPDTTPPAVSVTSPANNQTVSGTTPVSASATDNVAVASVQFFLDGEPLGNAVTASPYAISWDTTTASAGPHVLTAQATDTSGNVGTSTGVTVNVANPAAPMTCFVLQAQTSVHGRGTVTTPSFHTAAAGEVLVAFVSADGPPGSGKQTATVTGAGLTWRLVERENAESGDAEIWTATASGVLSAATVTSTLPQSGFDEDLTVVAMEGVSGIGATAGAAGAAGAPSTTLTTTDNTSLVFAVGHDYSNAVARTLPSGWVVLEQWLDTKAGDTYWSQYTNDPTGPAGSVITVNDLAPTNDNWDLAAVELLNDGS